MKKTLGKDRYYSRLEAAKKHPSFFFAETLSAGQRLMACKKIQEVLDH